FAAVAGLEGPSAELKEMVEMLLKPEKFERLGIRPVRGVLLVGPPGTGKTLLARAVAEEAGVRFYAVAAPEFHAPWVGEGARKVRELFARARDPRAQTPAVIFIDEIDSIGAERGGSALSGASHREYDMVLTQLLACMDGALLPGAPGGRPALPGERVLVIAATNRYEVLDRALTRPGRFDRLIQVRLPGARARERILSLHCARILAPIDANISAVARRARGMSGAQLAGLANEAAVRAFRRGGEEARVSEEDFAGALLAVRRTVGYVDE
ncbi:P-loop containing nucleoside triphosphate hydrolase protein, partial [Pavlovales sp. CCMP2436]